MSEGSRKKLFTAERVLKQRHGGAFAEAPSAPDYDSDKIIKAIEELKDAVLSSNAKEEAPSVADAPEMNVLRGQLHDLRESIEKTKHEIASVRHPDEATDRLTNAAMELDAIVRATEEATHNILNATEEIDEKVQELKDRIGDVTAHKTLDEISGLTIKVLEACNFQDISGQRTNKVVKTINYLEERILSMIEIWGAEEFTGIPGDRETKEGDAALLEGPQHSGEGVDQSDIDALFD